MPTISIEGISVEVPDNAVAVAHRWAAPLRSVARLLLDSAGNFNPRLQPALSRTGLAPVFRGLIELLVEATRLLASDDFTPKNSAPLLASIQDLIRRYIEGFVEALERVLRDWDQLGPIFFTQGAPDSLVRYALVALRGIDPLPHALAHGGRPSLVLHLKIGSSDISPTSRLDAELVYLPRDVESDCTVVGDTTHLCSCAPPYAYQLRPCAHPWCRSIAERINTQLADAAAIPTCVIWPAAPGSAEGVSPDDAYGYREYLTHDRPEDITVTSANAPEVGVFYRTLGRQLALAFICGMRHVKAGDFIIHQRRPYWIGLESAFAVALEDLRATGMFDAPAGPLAPPPRGTAPAPRGFGLNATTPPGPIPALGSLSEVRRGCAETLEALGALASELGGRFRGGRNLMSWFRPRGDGPTQDHHQRWLQLLSVTSSWSDWTALDRETAQWRSADDRAWTAHWFGGLLGQLQPTVSGWSDLPREAVEVLGPLRDQVTTALRVRSLQEVSVDKIFTLAPADREPIWAALVVMADVLSGCLRGSDWKPWLESAWDPRLVSALVEFETKDHARARLPYFIRRLQSASLWSAGNGEEVHLMDFKDAPPPRLARDAFFPEPMSVATARQLDLLANPGVRGRLVSRITQLMEVVSPRPSPPPVGPALGARSVVVVRAR